VTRGSAPGPGPYRAPRWLPDAHSQTIFPAVLARREAVAYRRERWDTPDGDFVDVDFAVSPPDGDPHAPLLVLFHGLEGSSDSHYARALMAAASRHGWRGAVAHFRGCSGEPNRLPRAYHSGDSEEIDWVLRRFKAGPAAASPMYAAGVSLGGNALLKWLGERGTDAGRLVVAAAGVSAPQDLRAGADALARGFSRVYTANFLATLRHKSLEKLGRFPGLFDADAVRAARTFHDFDDLVTAPLHGFASCWDYWARSSSRRFLGGVTVPTLVVNALNDPFVPADALARPGEVSAEVRLEYPAQGGHVGFASGPFPGRFAWLPERLLAFFEHG
jgi:predicted alpha/beta-fold hydrolase